nr:4631_t:CDS:2 [Entrophospora candida]
MELQKGLGGTEKLRENFAKIKIDANYYENGNGTRKNDKCAKTFGKFSNTELSIQKPECFR